MYKITDEQNLTAIRERQDIILKGNHPVHNTPHLTLFDIRFNASHKWIFKKEEGGQSLYDMIIFQLYRLLKLYFENKTFVHTQDQFNVLQNFYVKYYTISRDPFLEDVLGVIKDTLKRKNDFREVIFDNEPNYVYYYLSKDYPESRTFPLPKKQPIFAIPRHQYEFARSRKSQLHVSLFNLKDIALHNQELDKILSDQSDEEAIVESIQGYMSKKMTDGYLLKKGATQSSDASAPRLKVLPFTDISTSSGTIWISNELKKEETHSIEFPYGM